MGNTQVQNTEIQLWGLRGHWLKPSEAWLEADVGSEDLRPSVLGGHHDYQVLGQLDSNKMK